MNLQTFLLVDLDEFLQFEMLTILCDKIDFSVFDKCWYGEIKAVLKATCIEL